MGSAEEGVEGRHPTSEEERDAREALEAVRRVVEAAEGQDRLPPDVRRHLASYLGSHVHSLERRLERLAERKARGAAVDAPTPPAPAAPAAGPSRDVAPPRERQRKGPPIRVRTGPTLWERLGPVFAENLGFALAVFLIVAGAVYFVTTAWTTMSPVGRLFVVVGGIDVLGVLLFVTARLVNRRGDLPDVERVLLFTVAFLVPVGAVPAGRLLESASSFGLGLVAVLLVLVPGLLAARYLFRRLDPHLARGLLGPYAALVLLVALGPLGGRAPELMSALGAAALLAGTAFFDRNALPRLKASSGALLASLLLLFFTALLFAGRVALAALGTLPAARTLSGLGLMLAACGLAVAWLEDARSRTDRRAGARSVPLLVGALALGVTGPVLALGNDVVLLLAAAIGAAAALLAGFRLPLRWLAIPGLALSALAYLKLPAPVRETVLALRDQVAEGLGYARDRMPLGYYGLTFLPYVGGVGWWAFRLDRRGAARRATVLLVWSVGLGLALCALALATSGDPVGTDLRAPAAVLAAQGLLFVALGTGMDRRWLLRAGLVLLYGGIACLPLHFGARPSVLLLVVAATGALMAAVAAALRRVGPRRARRLGASMLEITSLALLAAAAWSVLAWSANPPPAAVDVAAGLLAATLFLVLGSAFSWPLDLVLACALLGFTGLHAFDLAFPDASADGKLLLFAALSALPLAAPRIERVVGRLLVHPWSRRGASLGAWAPFGVLLVQAFGWAQATDLGGEVFLPVGLGVGGLVLAVAAVRAREGVWLHVAALELLLAGPTAALPLGFSPTSTAALLGLAVALALVFSISRGVPPRVRELAERPVLHVVSLVVLWVFLWVGYLLVLRRGGYDPHGPGEALRLLLAVLVVAGTARWLYATARGGEEGEFGLTTGMVGGLLLGFAPIALLDALDARLDLYPLGLVGAALSTVVWAGRATALRAAAQVHAYAALAWGVVLGLDGRGDGWLLLATFVAVSVVGRAGARSAPGSGGLLFLLGGLAAVSIAAADRILGLDLVYQPALWIAFASLALFADHVPMLAIRPEVARLVALPILGLALLLGLVLSAFVAVFEPAVDFATPEALAGVWSAAAALVLAALAFRLEFRGRLSRTAPLLSLGVAAFAFAPVNGLLHGGWARFWRPDVEYALLAGLAALLPPRLLPGRKRVIRGVDVDLTPLLFLALGLVLTVAQHRDPSTPLTALAATFACLALFGREGVVLWMRMAVVLALATVYAAVLYLEPGKTTPDAGTLLVLAGASAGMAVLFALLAVLAARTNRDPRRRIVADALGDGAGYAVLLDVLFVAWSVGWAWDRPATGIEIAWAVPSLLVAAAATLSSAVRLQRPLLLHAGLGTLIVLYAFLAMRTDALAFLAGYHPHALALGGVLLTSTATRKESTLGPALVKDGLALTLPAVALYVPGALGAEDVTFQASSGLVIPSLAFGVAALRLGLVWAGWLSVLLLNLALYAFWRRLDLVDPAFYGVPPGLTLLTAAEVLRPRIGARARLQLAVPGLALLYGSVLVQVFRTEGPGHALILFGLGLATVLLGFWRRKNAWLVTGATVLVVDVVAYLLTHGFETTFLGAGLLVGAGFVVLAVATVTTRRRREAKREGDAPPVDAKPAPGPPAGSDEGG